MAFLFNRLLPPGAFPYNAPISTFDPADLRAPLAVAISGLAEWTVGDTLPPLSVVLMDKNGAVNLRDASVQVGMWPVADKSTRLVNAAGTIEPNQITNTGGLTYTWAAGDIAVWGPMLVEFKVTWNPDQIATWHVMISVFDNPS